jgi:hypothetical protein
MRFVRGWLSAIAVAALLVPTVAGCRSGVRPAARTSDEAALFGPRSMRIHPIFSQVKDWTGDGEPDGIEALLEFQDAFGDPTKAAGTVVFELFDYRAYNPDPRGERLASAWVGSLRTLDEQRARWNRTSRTYAFQLAYPDVRRDRSYVLSAAFDRGGDGRSEGASGVTGAGYAGPGASADARRYFDQIVIEADRARPAADDPATRPAGPAGAPAPSSQDPSKEPTGEQQQHPLVPPTQPGGRIPAP